MIFAVKHRHLTLRRAIFYLIAIAMVYRWSYVFPSIFWGKQNKSEPRIAKDSEETVATGLPLQNRAPDNNIVIEENNLPITAHTYRADGLLEVNPDAPHPIFELIERAEAEWERKLRRASRTLDEAVEEYKRRYRLPPPMGFNEWWAYVEEHNIQLPDEYDQIMRSLKPFWGIDEVDLRPIQQDWEAYPSSYTIGKDTNRNPLSLLNVSSNGKDNSRIDECFRLIKDLMRDVEEHIPPFRAIFSTADMPNLGFDWNVMQQALTAATEGIYIDTDDPVAVNDIGWLSGCDPQSAARKSGMKVGTTEGAPLPHNKTFIYNHRASMDPCMHPSLFWQHGQFLRDTGARLRDFLIPQFSLSTSMLHYDLVPAVPLGWVDGPTEADDLEWELKTDERLLWRGSNTGMWSMEGSRWRDSHRMRLVRLVSEGQNENLDVLRVPEDKDAPVGQSMPMNRGNIATSMLDIALVGSPKHCDPLVCEEIKEKYAFAKKLESAEAGKYKYVIDVDGYGRSSRFKRLITSNAMVFKSTIYPEWFTDRVQPWVHYVPVQIDLSDLVDALVFFRGNENGKSGHDNLARKIAMAGREWSKQFWRKEDMTAYMFRMFLEYSRVMSIGREGQYYYHNEPPQEVWDGSDH